MRLNRRTALFYALVLAAALWINSSFAQQVPTMGPDGWVLPTNAPAMGPYETAGMGPDPQWGGGYADTAYEACAYYGCSGDYLISIYECESGGDPNAWHPNPYGGSDVGIMQIHDATWGDIAYAGPVEQIWWAADMIASGYGHIWLCG